VAAIDVEITVLILVVFALIVILASVVWAIAV
jgi:hypothetical protein